MANTKQTKRMSASAERKMLAERTKAAKAAADAARAAASAAASAINGTMTECLINTKPGPVSEDKKHPDYKRGVIRRLTSLVTLNKMNKDSCPWLSNRLEKLLECSSFEKFTRLSKTNTGDSNEVITMPFVIRAILGDSYSPVYQDTCTSLNALLEELISVVQKDKLLAYRKHLKANRFLVYFLFLTTNNNMFDRFSMEYAKNKINHLVNFYFKLMLMSESDDDVSESRKYFQSFFENVDHWMGVQSDVIKLATKFATQYDKTQFESYSPAKMLTSLAVRMSVPSDHAMHISIEFWGKIKQFLERVLSVSNEWNDDNHKSFGVFVQTIEKNYSANLFTCEASIKISNSLLLRVNDTEPLLKSLLARRNSQQQSNDCESADKDAASSRDQDNIDRETRDAVASISSEESCHDTEDLCASSGDNNVQPVFESSCAFVNESMPFDVQNENILGTLSDTSSDSEENDDNPTMKVFVSTCGNNETTSNSQCFSSQKIEEKHEEPEVVTEEKSKSSSSAAIKAVHDELEMLDFTDQQFTFDLDDDQTECSGAPVLTGANVEEELVGLSSLPPPSSPNGNKRKRDSSSSSNSSCSDSENDVSAKKKKTTNLKKKNTPPRRSASSSSSSSSDSENDNAEQCRVVKKKSPKRKNVEPCSPLLATASSSTSSSSSSSESENEPPAKVAKTSSSACSSNEQNTAQVMRMLEQLNASMSEVLNKVSNCYAGIQDAEESRQRLYSKNVDQMEKEFACSKTIFEEANSTRKREFSELKKAISNVANSSSMPPPPPLPPVVSIQTPSSSSPTKTSKKSSAAPSTTTSDKQPVMSIKQFQSFMKNAMQIYMTPIPVDLKNSSADKLELPTPEPGAESASCAGKFYQIIREERGKAKMAKRLKAISTEELYQFLAYMPQYKNPAKNDDAKARRLDSTSSSSSYCQSPSSSLVDNVGESEEMDEAIASCESYRLSDKFCQMHNKILAAMAEDKKVDLAEMVIVGAINILSRVCSGTSKKIGYVSHYKTKKTRSDKMKDAISQKAICVVCSERKANMGYTDPERSQKATVVKFCGDCTQKRWEDVRELLPDCIKYSDMIPISFKGESLTVSKSSKLVNNKTGVSAISSRTDLIRRSKNEVVDTLCSNFIPQTPMR